MFQILISSSFVRPGHCTHLLLHASCKNISLFILPCSRDVTLLMGCRSKEMAAIMTVIIHYSKHVGRIQDRLNDVSDTGFSASLHHARLFAFLPTSIGFNSWPLQQLTLPDFWVRQHGRSGSLFRSAIDVQISASTTSQMYRTKKQTINIKFYRHPPGSLPAAFSSHRQ